MKTIKDLFDMLPEYPDHCDFPLYFSNALAGEVGEINNLVKKEYRDDISIREELKDEIGDAFNYLAYLCRCYEIDMETCIIQKIYKIREKIKE